MPFVIRKLNDAKTLGEELRALRKATGLTLSEMEERTKVRKVFIDAFECDRNDDLPETLYARNYLRTYLRGLGVPDPEYFVKRWEEARGTCDFTDASRLPRQRVRGASMFVASRLVKVAGIAVLLVAVTAYIGYEVRSITSAPPLVVMGPSDGLATGDATVAVNGSTDPGTSVLVNGEKVLLNTDGSFATNVSLERGLNVIKIEGTKRYSRTNVEYRRVVLEAEKNTAFVPTGLNQFP